MATPGRVASVPALLGEASAGTPNPKNTDRGGWGRRGGAHTILGGCGSAEGTSTRRVLLRCPHHSSFLISSHHSLFLGVTRPAEQRAKMPRLRGLQPRRQRRRQHLSIETLQLLCATAAWHVVAAARQVVGELLPRWTA
jgi:hypothetical protein